MLRRVTTGLWRTVVVLYSLFFLLLLIAVPAGIYFALNPGAAPVPDKAVLVVAPSGSLVEQDSGVASIVSTLGTQNDTPSVTRDLITALDRAADDARIKQVLLKLDDFSGAAPGQLQDLVGAVDRFRESGKPVIAWSDAYSQAQYELASHADTIALDPLGYTLLTGYGVYNNYYKDAIDKLGVTVNVFRVGKYKSFVEPYVRNDMSAEARDDALAWSGTLWDIYRDVVSQKRDFSPDAIDAYIDNYAQRMEAADGDAAAVAREAGLIDRVASINELRPDFVDAAGEDSESGTFNQVDVDDYLADTARQASAGEQKQLAVVTIEGNIIDGSSTPGSAGGDTVAGLIDRARRDDAIGGVLLRVNSPGGSVTASEQIRRALVALKAAGKPVVVSMAGVAASGGYWVSMNADEIWAEPSTITGSIGIFAIVPTFNEPLNKLGIHTDGVGTTELAGVMRLDKPLSEQAKRILQAGIEHGYDTFVGNVAQARGLSRDEVDAIAQGRVWAGVDAKRIGLVDELGGPSAAARALAKRVGLDTDNPTLQELAPPPDWRSALTDVVGIKGIDAVLPDWLGRITHAAAAPEVLAGLNDPHGLYARCFCALEDNAVSFSAVP